MEIDKDLENEIIKYCEINSVSDTNKFINNLIRQGFTIKKYGNLPTLNKSETSKNAEVIDTIKQINEEPIIKTTIKNNIYGD